jgi:streptomycin 6-kinase
MPKITPIRQQTSSDKDAATATASTVIGDIELPPPAPPPLLVPLREWVSAGLEGEDDGVLVSDGAAAGHWSLVVN